MKKRLLSLFLALTFSLPILSAVPVQSQTSTTVPIPVVTVTPEKPENPQAPPVSPQDIPDDGKGPNPRPIDH